MKVVIGLFIAMLLVAGGFTQTVGGGGEKYPDLRTNQKLLKEWQDMKFGMFIHWGPVTLRGTEIGWSRGREVEIADYDSLYLEFNPVLFDAKEWVTAAKEAGMKYLVITAKHHDGFSLWDTEYSDYDIMSTPYAKDILKELAAECEKQGILFCTYYSIIDWYHPHYTTRYGGDPRPVEDSDMDIYVEFMNNQLRELVEKYDTNMFWYDGHWEASWTHDYGMDLYAYCRSLKDDVLINNRVDKGRTGHHGQTESAKFAGDFGTPEQVVGAFDVENAWESCITICNQWAWKPNDVLKSYRECLHTLVQTVGGGGNLLFNVGPMMDGRIEKRQIDRLKQMGDWLQKNGESIYETQGGPFIANEWMVSTHKNEKIYVHLMQWPDGKLVLPALNGHKVKNVRFLNGNDLKFKQDKNALVVMLPDKAPDPVVTVLQLQLDKDAGEIKPLDVPKNVLKNQTASNISLTYAFSKKYAAKGARSLVDKVYGTNNYNDRRWLGFEGTDLEAVIDLESLKSIEQVKIGFLQNQNDWIFFPASVTVSVSDDGASFKQVGEAKNIKIMDDPAVEKTMVSIGTGDAKGQFVKIVAENIRTCPVWHKGAGGKAWLFVDEIEVH